MLESGPAKAGGLGGEPEVVTTAPVWHADEAIVRGTVKVLGEECRYLDYRNKLVGLPPEFSSRFGVARDEPEERQRLCLQPAAAILMRQFAKEPSAPDVQRLALVLRLHLWDAAGEAWSSLGDPPPWMTQEAADLRMHCHDALQPHHEKDYRTFQTFPYEALDRTILHIWRVDRWGMLRIDILAGRRAEIDTAPLVVKIATRHMQTLVEPSPGATTRLVGQRPAMGRPAREIHTTGWEAQLDGADLTLPLVAARPACTRCTEASKAEPDMAKVGGQSSQVPFSFNELEVDMQAGGRGIQ